MPKTTHGLSHTYEYQCWVDMMKRCYRPTTAYYENYGGRGITVHPSLQTFEGFLALMKQAPKGFTVDRIDSNGNYEPGNIRWANRKTQNRNTRRNRYLTFQGKTQSMADWSEELGIPYTTLNTRTDRGWSDEKTLSTPRREQDAGTKLGPEDIRFILESNAPCTELQLRFNVVSSTIYRIRNGQRQKRLVASLRPAHSE